MNIHSNSNNNNNNNIYPGSPLALAVFSGALQIDKSYWTEWDVLLGSFIPLEQTRTQSLFVCFGGKRRVWEEWRRGNGIFPLSFPMRPRACLNLTPTLLSPPKHTNSDWVGVCLWKWKEMKLYYVLAFTALLEFLLEIIILHLNKPQTGLQYSRPLTNMSL